MAAVTGVILAFGTLGFALLTGCGGHASSPRLDGSSGGSPASNGGMGAAPSSPAAGGALAVAGNPSPNVGGAPASAFQGSSRAGESAGGAAQAGAPSNAGNAAGAAAGASGEAAAGASGATGVSPEAVAAACSSLCDSLQLCVHIWEFGPTCVSDCVGDLSLQNGGCADAGLEMSACLEIANHDPVLSGSTECIDHWSNAQSRCFRKIEAFQKCVAGSRGSAPPSNICLRIGHQAVWPEGECKEGRACLDSKLYRLECTDTTDGKSTCACTQGGYKNTFTFDESTVEACSEHIADCIAAANPPK